MNKVKEGAMKLVGRFVALLLTRAQLIAAIVLVLIASVSSAQQPPGQIAYTWGSLDLSSVRLINSDGTNDRPLSPLIRLGGHPANAASLGMPVWSKDGRLIAANALLSGNGLAGCCTPSKVLAVFDPVTGQGDAVFDTSRGSGPTSIYWINAAFAPDGNRLVYSSLQTNFVEYGIVNRDGTGTVPLFFTNLTEEAIGVGVDWSPRTDQLGGFGNQLVVSYPYLEYSCLGIPRTVAGLFLVRMVFNGGNPQPSLVSQILTQPAQPPCNIWEFNSVHDWYPVFSPDGSQVAFVRVVKDSNAVVTASTIMLISLTAGTQPQQLLSLPGELVNHLSWSPDGSRLIFDRTQVGFAGLTNPLGVWITSSDGSRLLAPFLGPATFAPAWGGATGR